jgi:hypothetical protein
MKPSGAVPLIQEAFWIYRPYFFKLDSYEYETEVRLVVSVDPKRIQNTSRSAGVVIDVVPDTLIAKVVNSPHVNRDEAECLEDMLKNRPTELLNAKVDTSQLLSAEVQKFSANPRATLRSENSDVEASNNPFLGSAIENENVEGKLFSTQPV